jgi:hypothetical protein
MGEAGSKDEAEAEAGAAAAAARLTAALALALGLGCCVTVGDPRRSCAPAATEGVAPPLAPWLSSNQLPSAATLGAAAAVVDWRSAVPPPARCSNAGCAMKYSTATIASAGSKSTNAVDDGAATTALARGPASVPACGGGRGSRGCPPAELHTKVDGPPATAAAAAPDPPLARPNMTMECLCDGYDELQHCCVLLGKVGAGDERQPPAGYLSSAGATLRVARMATPLRATTQHPPR